MWLSAPAAARVLGVAHVTVLRWVKSGKLIPIGYVKQDSGRPSPVFDAQYIDRIAEQRRKVGLATAA
jgi:predicted site-specific integrase-resolvase